MSKTSNGKCSIKTKREIKKPFVKNSHTKFWLSAPKGLSYTAPRAHPAQAADFLKQSLLCLSLRHLRQVRAVAGGCKEGNPQVELPEINHTEHMSKLEKLLLSKQSKTIQSLSQMAITFIPEAFQNTGF